MSTLKAIPLRRSRDRAVRVPIRIKITIPYLILSVILAVAAAFLITQIVVENVQERFNKQLYEAGKISSELSVSYEAQLLETERLLANVDGLAAAIQSNDANKLRSLTLGIIANDQQEAVEFLDVHGSHVLSVRHKTGGNPEEYNFSTGGQSLFSNLEIVQNVLAQKSDGRGDKYADLVQSDAGVFLYVLGAIGNARGNIF